MKWLAALLAVVLVVALALACEEEGTTAPGAGPPKVERIVRGGEGAMAEAEGVRITLNAIVDPWVMGSTFLQQYPGRRFLAFDVTIEQVSGSHYASDLNFQLTDAEGFAHDPEWLAGVEPDLEGIHLGNGQKTRGWVTFEVNAGTPIKLLKYDPDIFTTNDIEFQW